MDWTNSFDQKEINEFSNNVTNYFLDELTNLKLSHHSELNLSRKEIELMYRRSLSLSISTFTERLLRTICNNKQFQKINLKMFAKMKTPILIDARGIIDFTSTNSSGLVFRGLGRIV